MSRQNNLNFCQPAGNTERDKYAKTEVQNYAKSTYPVMGPIKTFSANQCEDARKENIERIVNAVK